MRRTFLAALALVAALFGMSMTAVPPASANAISPDAELGFQQISQCLQSRSDLAVLLVVDESGSLQDTDPNDKRSLLLANLVRSLGRQAGTPTAEGARRIDLAVSTFALTYNPLVPWTELNSDSTERIAGTLETEIPNLDNGGGTNHPEAIAGARNQMAELSATTNFERPPCQVTILFTDGVLYVDDDPTANAAAAQSMCAPGGVVDGARRDGINLVTVMLFDPAVAESNPVDYQEGRALLQAAAEGSAQGITCGTQPIPPEFARGAYLEGNVDRLASLFASAFALSQGGTLIPLEGSSATVQIDPGISSFTVVGLASQGITLARPDGQQIPIDKDSPGTDQAQAVWDFDNVTVDAPIDDTGLGRWTITRPGQNDEASVFLNTGLGLKLGNVSLISGERAEIEGTVVRPGSDEPVDLSVYSAATMTASAVGASADPIEVNSNGTFAGSITPDSDSTTTTFDVTLNLTTASGTELQPVSGRFTLPVTLPREFAQVQPVQLTLSPLVGRDGRSEGSLTVTGSPDGATRVCVDPMMWTAVDDANRYTTEQTQGCFDLAAGEPRTIDVAVVTSDATDERVGGELPMVVTSVSGTERAVNVPVAFTASAPVNQGVRLGIVAILTALAILLPLILLYLFNRRLARFLPADGTRSVAIPATVSTTGIKAKETVTAGAAASPTKPAAAFDIPAEKLRVMPAMDKPQREIPGPDGSSLQTKMPKNLFGNPTAVVVAGPGSRVFSNQAPYVHGDGSTAPVSMGLGDVWYATVSDAALLSGDLSTGVPALISAFVAPKGQGDSLADVAARVRQFKHYEALLTRLQVAAKEDAMKAAAGGSGPTGVANSSSPGSRPGGPSGPGPSGGTRPSGPPGPSGARPGGPVGPSGSPPPGGSNRPSGPPPRPSGPTGPAGPAAPSGPPRPSGPSPQPPAPGGGSARPPGPKPPSGPSGPRPDGPRPQGPSK